MEREREKIHIHVCIRLYFYVNLHIHTCKMHRSLSLSFGNRCSCIVHSVTVNTLRSVSAGDNATNACAGAHADTQLHASKTIDKQCLLAIYIYIYISLSEGTSNVT